jgi:hypothetical protein
MRIPISVANLNRRFGYFQLHIHQSRVSIGKPSYFGHNRDKCNTTHYRKSTLEMTTIFNIKKTCAVCGKTNDYTGIGSTNRFGAPDLDTRPPEMMRSTIRYWVQRCPSCGHCSPDVSDAKKSINATIQSADYQAQLCEASFPTLANTFLCWAIIQESGGDLLGAAWSSLHAAWIGDDENERAAAKTCRRMAIARFQSVIAHDLLISQQAGMESALLADLHRRSGDFEAVATLIDRGMAAKPDAVVEKMLIFQRVLADNRDGGCYTIAQAEEYEED